MSVRIALADFPGIDEKDSMQPEKPEARAAASIGGDLWIAAMPAVFVLLWSSGFIFAKLSNSYADPLTTLLLRFLFTAGLLIVAAVLFRAPWPRDRALIARIAITGVLLQGVYLGGVFTAVDLGVPAGVAALISALQPLLTAIAAGPFLGERVTARQWLGLVMGLAGVALVVSNKIEFHPDHLVGIACAFAAVFGITAGTLYQKRHCVGMDLRSGSAIQFIAAAVMMVVLAPVVGTLDVRWTLGFAGVMFWLVVVMSLGAVTLLYVLIRRGAVAKVASLFYLTPPVVAVVSFFLFGETLSPVALAGMAVTVAGVALVTVRRA